MEAQRLSCKPISTLSTCYITLNTPTVAAAVFGKSNYCYFFFVVPSIVFLYGICWFFSVNSILCSWIYINSIPCTHACIKAMNKQTILANFEFYLMERAFACRCLHRSCVACVCVWFAKSIWKCFVFICLSLDVCIMFIVLFVMWRFNRHLTNWQFTWF